MFSPNPSIKLPKAVIMMIEKNNLVMAIKTLAADENISMDAAKARIDAYETALKVKQQQNLNTIANKQGIPNQAISFDREQSEEDSERLIKNRVKTTKSEKGFKSLQNGVDSQLKDLGYKKPLMPYWSKRVLVITLVMVGLFWILWRVFG
jgi:molecular chaperone DnaK (HSP70)